MKKRYRLRLPHFFTLLYLIQRLYLYGNTTLKLNFSCEKFGKDYLEFEIGGRKIYLVHRLLKRDTNYLGKDFVFTGHYHSQKTWEQNGVKIVRPGGLENDINFAVYDTKTNEVEFIHE